MKIGKILNYLLLCILIVTLLYTLYSKYIRKDPIVKLGGYGILIVMTGSMEPTIKENELIVIKENEKYNLNDIITYVDIYGNLITHRISQIDEYSFITKGDSNKIADESTNIHNIQGKVIYHSKILGVFILYYLKFVILICIIVLLGFRIKEVCYEKKEE